jgi:hypothetical protein
VHGKLIRDPLFGRHRLRDDDALRRLGRDNLSHPEAAVPQKVVELLTCPFHRRVLHHHVEIRELAFRHLIGWTDNALDYDELPWLRWHDGRSAECRWMFRRPNHVISLS